MKLFHRTFGSFIAVICLQAVLSAAALAFVVGSMQSEDAAKKLETEAAASFDAFNAWKLALWKHINELAEDGPLAAAIGASAAPAESRNVADILRGRLAGRDLDGVLVRDAAGGPLRALALDSGDAPFPYPAILSNRKPHPYIDIVSVPAGTWFVGVLRAGSPGRRAADIFLLKRIDDELVRQLSHDPSIAVLVWDSETSVTGTAAGSDESADPRIRGAAAASALDFLDIVRGTTRENAYETFGPKNGPSGAYRAAAMKSGEVSNSTAGDTINIGVVLSLAEYDALASGIREAVIGVSLLVAAITILIALGFTRSIASPIRRLVSAMRRIEEGDLGAEVDASDKGELGELQNGFNDMARILRTDREAMDAYIAQIVNLKDYGDLVIDAMRGGLAVFDAECVVEKSNKAFRELFALAEPSGQRLTEIGDGPFDADFAECVRAMKARDGKTLRTFRRKSGGRTFEMALYPLGGADAAQSDRFRVVLFIEDSSERIAYEERAIRAEKLAGIGMLSAGVAHEINNPLSSILSNVQNLIDEEPDREKNDILRLIERETIRIARIVRQLLDFSAPRDVGMGEEISRCDPNKVVDDLVKLIGYPFRKDSRIRMTTALDPACAGAAIPEDELKQVLLNVIKNAVEAIGQRGLVRVATRAMPDSVEISVADSGPGIPEGIAGRIFDPFFTTKTDSVHGEGMGLGLSVAYGIVTKYGGNIKVENGRTDEDLPGAVLRIALPAAPETAAPEELF